ncbi:MAG: GNAT family N-acetyltransferase [Acidobacteriota bacterium]|jgi:predicted acetyltransferase|nr:GNAT family N-acetyltransferase [Acidobacteriota bacterium]
MGNLVYAEAELFDLPQISRLYSLLAYEMKEITNDDYFNFDTLSDEVMLNYLEQSVRENSIKIYIAKNNDDVIGFLSGSITHCFLPMSKVGKIGYIDAAYVKKDFRKKGVMTKLEKTMVEYFKSKNLEYVELNALAGNIKGKRFWNEANYVTFREQMRKRIGGY